MDIRISGKNDGASTYEEQVWSELSVGGNYNGETEAVFLDMYPDAKNDEYYVSLNIDTFDEALTFFKTCVAMFEGLIKERDASNAKWDREHKED